MFKNSEDNDTWKLDDFKKDVLSIDFHRILAADCRGNWLEQQLPQQRRLHPTTIKVKANEDAKEEYRQSLYKPKKNLHSCDLLIQGIPLNQEVPGNRLPKTGSRQILLHARELPAEGIFSHRGQKTEQQIKAILGAVLKQFQVDDIQNPPRIRHISSQCRFSRRGQRFPAQAEDFPPSQGSKLSRQDSKSVTCRDPCRGRPRKEIQSGVRLDRHIFLSIPVQRACQIKAEKIAKAGSQAHAQRR
ncbi:hypothetical protein V6N13_034058 [Hibiscus sabdariffa]